MILNVRGVYRYTENEIEKYFVYIGDSDYSKIIVAGEIGEKNDERLYIELDNLNMVLYIDKLFEITSNVNITQLFIKGEHYYISAYKFQTLINSLTNMLLNKFERNILSTTNKNYDEDNSKIVDLTLPEKIIRLIIWNDKKREIKFDDRKLIERCYQFDVYFAYLGVNVGNEIEKLRPVVIWKQHINKTNPKDTSYYVFPISSKTSNKIYYYNVEIDINGEKNYVKINDGKRISSLRIIKPLKNKTTKKTHKLAEEEIQRIKNAITKYFSLENEHTI